jgi:hypothetical protein
LRNVDQYFYENIDETFRKNVESNVFSQKMLIQLFSEKCWLKNVASIFSLKNVPTFCTCWWKNKKKEA